MKRFPKSIKLLDEKMAKNYREHMFLENPLVPEKVRNSVSKEIHISFNSMKDETHNGIKIFLSQEHLKAHAWHHERYLDDFENYSVIKVSVSPTLTFDFGQLANRSIGNFK